MKKLLLLLLLATSIGYAQVPADATPLENIQITNNATSTTATKVVVQESTGVLNTKPLDATVVQSSINPITGGAVYTGLAGKFNTPTGLTTNYLPKWNGSGFGNSVIQENSSRVTIDKTWNGTSNFPLDIRGFNGAGESVIRTETFEDTSYGIEMYSKYDNSNKAGLRNATGNIIKQNISGDVILGVSNNTFVDASGYVNTIPAVNSNQVVVKSQLDAFVPSGTLNTSGNQSWTGLKSSTNTGTTHLNGISLTNNGTNINVGVLRVQNNSTGSGIYLNNSVAGGTGLYGITTAGSVISVVSGGASSNGISVDCNNTGNGIYSRTSSNGNAIYVRTETNSGKGVFIESVVGIGEALSINAVSNSGLSIASKNNGTTTFSVNKTGDITANTFTLTGYTVATLPTGSIGMTAYVTNALSPVSLAAVVGGGAVVVRVFHNGVTWIVQ